MFDSQNYELFLKKIEQKREINRVGNSVGGVMLISSGFTLILNIVTAIVLQILSKTTLLNDAGFQLILQLAFSTLIFTLPMILLPLFTGDNFNEVFLLKKVPTVTCTQLIFIGFGVIALSNIGNNIFASILSSFGMTPVGYEFDLPSGFFGTFLVFLSGALAPALVEEFALRGMVLGVVKKHFGNGPAILVSSIIFSLMHGNLQQIPFALLLGLYLGYITVYTGSILPAVILHFANNFISFALDLITTNLGPTASNLITILYFVIVLCIGLFGVIWFAQSNNSFEIKCGQTKKFTLGIIKTPAMIVYIITIAIQVIITQLGA